MLTIARHAVEKMKTCAARFPRIEVTGFVAVGPHGQRVQPMQNVSPYPDKYYDWDPAEMLEQFNAMDRNGEEPLCFYHSHPSGKSDPSETDMIGALNVGMYYVILYPETEDFCPDGLCQPIATLSDWKMSVWECIEMGVLVSAEYEVAP